MAKKNKPIPRCKNCHTSDWERQEVEEYVTTTYLLDLKNVWRVADVTCSNSETNFCCRQCGRMVASEKKELALRDMPVDLPNRARLVPCEPQ